MIFSQPENLMQQMLSDIASLKDKVGTLDNRLSTLETSRPASEIWISPQRLNRLPVFGAEWEAVTADAHRLNGPIRLDSLTSNNDAYVYANALIAVHDDNPFYHQRVEDALDTLLVSPLDRTLELARSLPGPLLAVLLTGYRPAGFDDWLVKTVNANITGHGGVGLIGTAVHSANNWGSHARLALLLAGIVLENSSWIDIVVTAHRGMLGTGTSELKFSDTTWHDNPNEPAGINPAYATRDGVVIAGIIPEDWRRDPNNYDFTMMPQRNYYMTETCQGLLPTMLLLDQLGLVPLSEGNTAGKRVVDMLYRQGLAANNPAAFYFPFEGDDLWLTYLSNYMFDTNLPTQIGQPGKNIGYTYYTHNKALA